jgi:hypothetical protein
MPPGLYRALIPILLVCSHVQGRNDTGFILHTVDYGPGSSYPLVIDLQVQLSYILFIEQSMSVENVRVY